MSRMTDQIQKIQKTGSRKTEAVSRRVGSPQVKPVAKKSLTTYRLRLAVLLLTTYHLLLTTSGLYGAFEDIGVGARPVSMGAYTAVCDDANAVFYNPAGLSRFIYPELTSSYGKLYWGLNGPDESNLSNSSIAFVYPKYFGTIGFGWLNLDLQGYYTEDSIIASYGRNVTRKISLGLNLKYLNRKYGSDIYTPHFEVFKNGYSKSVFSSDVGFLFREDVWSVALFSADVNQPDVGLMSADKLPTMFKLATAYRIKDLNIGIDTFYKNLRYGISLGGEKTFKTFAVRGGFEFGKDDLRNLTIGFGNRFADKFFIDYAFLYPFSGIKEIIGTHRISLGFKFGPLPKDEITSSRKEIEKLTEDIAVLEKNLEEVKEENLYVNRKLRMTEMEGIEKEIEKKKIMKDYYSKGLKYYQNGNYKKAISEFEKILKYDPGHSQSKNLVERCKIKIEEMSAELYYSGFKEYTRGNIKGAVSFWKRAYELTPEDEKIKNALEKAEAELK